MVQTKTKTRTKSVTTKTEAHQSTAIARRELTTDIEHRVKELTNAGEIQLPKSYSINNAVKGAWLKIQEIRTKEGQTALDVATKASVYNALLDMAIQGLNPLREQCYFVMFGRKLTCMRSSKGTVALLKRVYGDATDVRAEAIYDGDELEWDIIDGRRKMSRHAQDFSNIHPDRLAGAYCVIHIEGREPHTEVMTMEQIRRAWKMGAAGGTSDAHEQFPEEMAKKTVINRACKYLIATSDDKYLTGIMERQGLLVAEAQVDAEVEEQANREVISVEHAIDEEGETEPVAATREEAVSDEDETNAKGPGF